MYTYYDFNGEETSEPIDNYSAYKVKKDGHTNYFLKRLSNGQLFDPAKIKDFNYTKGQWKFRKVNEESFNLYVRFLKTNHRFLLSHAERTI